MTTIRASYVDLSALPFESFIAERRPSWEKS